MPDITHFDLDLDGDGVPERYDLRDTNVENKVDKIPNKELSSFDYDYEEKYKNYSSAVYEYNSFGNYDPENAIFTYLTHTAHEPNDESETEDPNRDGGSSTDDRYNKKFKRPFLMSSVLDALQGTIEGVARTLYYYFSDHVDDIYKNFYFKKNEELELNSYIAFGLGNSSNQIRVIIDLYKPVAEDVTGVEVITSTMSWARGEGANLTSPTFESMTIQDNKQLSVLISTTSTVQLRKFYYAAFNKLKIKFI